MTTTTSATMATTAAPPKANSLWRLRCVEWQINTDILIRNCTQLNSNKTATSVSHLIAWRLPSRITVRISMSALLSVCKIANYLITRCVRASIEFSFANKQKNKTRQHSTNHLESSGRAGGGGGFLHMSTTLPQPVARVRNK